MPIIYADTPAAVEEERRLLYVGMTRARQRPHRLLGAGPHPGRPRRPASRPGSSTGCGPTSAAAGRRARPAAASARASRTAASAAGRWRPPPRSKLGRCADCPRPTTRSCSSGCASGAASGPPRRACRRSSCSPTRPCRLIAELKPADAEALLRDQRHRPGQARPSTATRCSRWSRGSPSTPPPEPPPACRRPGDGRRWPTRTSRPAGR